jgi:hypothetical protein
MFVLYLRSTWHASLSTCIFRSVLLALCISIFISLFYGHGAVNFLINFLCDRDKVVVLVTKSMKNPRSALCKTAIMSSADIFKGYPEHLLDILDPLVHACFIACFLEY